MVDLITLARLDSRVSATPSHMCPGFTLERELLLGIGKFQLLEEAIVSTFETVFGRCPPPPGGSFLSGSTMVSWLAPREWLLTGEDAQVQTMIEQIEDVAECALAMDVSHARAAILVTGSHARDALAAMTSLDISDTVFRAGDVARASFGDVAMFLARLSDQAGIPRFRMIIDQTMAAYAVRILGETTLAAGASA